MTATDQALPRTLVVLDRDECGVDAFERYIGEQHPDVMNLRIIVRSASGSAEDLDEAQALLHDATRSAQGRGFTESGWAIVATARDLDAELADAIQFDNAVIIMPEAAWPTSQSARLRRSAKRYGALVQFDCIPSE